MATKELHTKEQRKQELDWLLKHHASELRRLLRSQFRIKYTGYDYEIRDIKNKCLVSVDHLTFRDALFFLTDDIGII
jgi:hypothetical protein